MGRKLFRFSVSVKRGRKITRGGRIIDNSITSEKVRAVADKWLSGCPYRIERRKAYISGATADITSSREQKNNGPKWCFPSHMVW
jgi:hypothetical protein